MNLHDEKVPDAIGHRGILCILSLLWTASMSPSLEKAMAFNKGERSFDCLMMIEFTKYESGRRSLNKLSETILTS